MLLMLIQPFFSSVLFAHTGIQKKNILSGDSISIKEFIQKTEREHGIKFFYDPEWFTNTDHMEVELKSKEITNIIREFFKIYGYEVFFQNNNVFISQGMIIEPDFAVDFIKNLKEVKERPLIKDVIYEEVQHIDLTTINPELELIRFGVPSSKVRDKRFRISGTVTGEEGINELIPGATIQIAGTTLGAVTDMNGRYTLVLTPGQYEVIFRAVGKRTTKRQISLFTDGNLNISLSDDIIPIEEVQVVAKKHDKVNLMMGADNLDIQMMKKSIMMLGEADIIKSVLTLPGVQTATEVSAGFNVRGGDVDQNLVLVDNIPIMNVNHFFGFFSAFNADMIGKATLYKSGIPASFGGRLSSVLEISSREGDKKKFKAEGGISPFTGRLSIEGPVVKEKLSYIVGARSTYSNWILRRMEDPRIRNSAASFNDIHGNISYDISEKQRLYFTFYKSDDYFRFDQISSNEYSNRAYSLSYENTMSDKLSFSSSLSSSTYKFGVTDELVPSLAKSSAYEINQYGLRSNFNYFLNNYLDLNYGINGIFYNTVPGIIKPFNEKSLINPRSLEREKAFEGAIYISNKQNLSNRLSILYGLRYSGFGIFGPRMVFIYDPDSPKSVQSIRDTVFYPSNKPVKTYSGLEPRFFAKYRTGPNSSVKLGYNRSLQYINLIYNTVSPAPTDIWKFSDPHILPQTGDHLSIGYFRDFKSGNLFLYSFSIETYYKISENILDYKVGAELFTNEHFETEMVTGENKSYGIELQLIKEAGSLSGWVSYTYSRSLNRFSSIWPEETINAGNFFPANYDKPHNLKAVVNYDFFRRLRMSGNFIYSNGRPLTLPQTVFIFGDAQRIQFSDRNKYRFPDYFRIDLSATYEGNYKVNKPAHGSVTFSVINLTGRINPYSVFYQYDRFRRLKAYTLSIFGAPIFSITYNFKF